MNGEFQHTQWINSLMDSKLDGVYGKGKQMGNLENVLEIFRQPGFLL